MTGSGRRKKKGTKRSDSEPRQRTKTDPGGFTPAEEETGESDTGSRGIAAYVEPGSDLAKGPSPFPPAAAEPPIVQKDDFDRTPPVFDRALLEKRMQDHLGGENLEGALEAAEEILRNEPEHWEAGRVAQLARERLTESYLARLGSTERVPRVVLSREEIMELGLDARSGFVLSRIDGEVTLQEVLDMTGMTPFEVLRILCDLLFAEIIAFD